MSDYPTIRQLRPIVRANPSEIRSKELYNRERTIAFCKCGGYDTK